MRWEEGPAGELVQSWKYAIMHGLLQGFTLAIIWGGGYVRHLTQLFIITQFLYITLIKNVCHFSNVI